MIECLKNNGRRFVTLYRKQGSKPSPRKSNAKGQNGCLRSLTNSYEKKRGEKQRRKGKIYPGKFRVPKNSKESSLSRLLLARCSTHTGEDCDPLGSPNSERDGSQAGNEY